MRVFEKKKSKKYPQSSNNWKKQIRNEKNHKKKRKKRTRDKEDLKKLKNNLELWPFMGLMKHWKVYIKRRLVEELLI